MTYFCIVIGVKEYQGAGSKFYWAAIAPGRGYTLLGDDSTITLWNFTDSEPLEYNDCLTSDASVCNFTRDEKYGVVGSSKGTVIVWNYDQNKTVATFKGHMNQISAIGVPNDPDWVNYIASGSKDTNVKLWDMRSKKSSGTFKGHEDQITGVDISPDNQYLASSSLDGTVKIWDTWAGKWIKTFAASTVLGVKAICFNPAQYCVAASCGDRRIRYYDLNT